MRFIDSLADAIVYAASSAEDKGRAAKDIYDLVCRDLKQEVQKLLLEQAYARVCNRVEVSNDVAESVTGHS